MSQSRTDYRWVLVRPQSLVGPPRRGGRGAKAPYLTEGLRALAAVAFSVMLAGSLCAQPAALPAAAPQGDITNSNIVPPPPSPAKAPVELFRQLLQMDRAEQQKFLENRPPETRKLLAEKIREYQALSPEERELRLRVTELRWYLRPLMQLGTTNRAERLAAVPAELRDLVEERLRRWDTLPPAVQQEFWEKEDLVQRFTQPVDAARERQDQGLTAQQRAQLEERLRAWQALPEKQREEITTRFNEYFVFNRQERQKILSTLSEPERLQIEKTLQTFRNLGPERRTRALRSFEKFACLTPAERQQFLRSAERWKLMTPTERQAWRGLVSRLSQEPPLPWDLRPPPPPPPQPTARFSHPPVPIATNR